MKRIIVTKAVALAIMLLLACSFCGALADSPVGRWSGSFGGEGRKSSASATFRKDGSCTLRAMGISASGSYGGGSITVSAYGYTLTLSYTCKGDRMTISGRKGKYSGHMTLKRVSGGSSSEESEKKEEAGETRSVYGQWSAQTEAVKIELRIYKDGYLYWQETPLTTESSDVVHATAVRMTESKGKLVLSSLHDLVTFDAPSLWEQFKTETGTGWDIAFIVSKDELTLLDGDDVVLVFKRVGETDIKPSEDEFLPYILLKKGDQGEAVKRLQTALVTAGHLEGEADGIFGGKTEKAVKAFQKAHALEVDGVAGKEVLTALFP